MNFSDHFRRRVFGVASAAALVVAPLTFSEPASAAPTQVSVIANSWIGFAPVYVAEDMGYFKKLGINVVMTVDESKSDALAALERGDVTVGMMTVDDLQRAPWANGNSGTVIGTIDESLGGDAVVADGSVHSVTDLKGKLVATSANLPATMLLQLELAKHNMSLTDMDVRQIDGEDAVSVFANHSVAAVGTYQPYISTILKVDAARHPHVLISSAQYPGYVVDVAVVMKKTAAAEPAALKAFLTGIYQAVALYNSHPAKFAALAAPHFNLTPAAFQDTVSSSLSYTTLGKAQMYLGSPGHTGKLFDAFNAIEQLNLSTGAMKTTIPATTALDNSIISGIAPTAVQ